MTEQTNIPLAAPVKQVYLSVAEALLKDVPRWRPSNFMMMPENNGDWVSLDAVLAALTATTEERHD